MKKTIMIVVSILIVMMIGAGCMKNEEQKERGGKEEFLAHMREKYNEEFTVTGGGDQSWNDPSLNVYCYSESHPDQEVKAWWNGETASDNYLYILYQDEAEVMLREILDPIYEDYKVFFAIGSPSGVFEADMTFDEFIKAISKNGMGFDICVQDEHYMNTKDEKLEMVRLALKDKEFEPSFTVLYMEPGRLNEVNDDNLLELFTGKTSEEWLVMRGDISLDKNYDYLYADWSDE